MVNLTQQLQVRGWKDPLGTPLEIGHFFQTECLPGTE